MLISDRYIIEPGEQYLPDYNSISFGKAQAGYNVNIFKSGALESQIALCILNECREQSSCIPVN